MKPRSRYVLVCLVLTAAFCNTYALKPKGASLTVKARLNATSYLLEALEFLADEDSSLLWHFLDYLSDTSVVAAGAKAGDEACWRNITKAASELLTPGVGKLLPLVLASRQYAAKLQMIRQMAEQLHGKETACCFVSVDGRAAATPLMLTDLLTAADHAYDNDNSMPYSADEQLISFDHVYAHHHGADADGDAGPRRVAILYGSPGLPCFGPMHRMLKTAAANSNGRLTYAFRPLLMPQCEVFAGCARTGTGGQLQLPGWGVEAALKNTEYSAMDDKEAAAGRQGAAADDTSVDDPFGSGPSAVVKGFRFDVLAERKPELRQDLLTFRDTLLAGDDGEADVKVWDLRDVSMQATQRILGSSDPLGLMAELSQNFPGLVASLSRQPVNASLRSTIFRGKQLISDGANYLLLNGLVVDVNNFDFFGFLSRLRSEVRLRDALVVPRLGLGLPPGLVSQLLMLRAEEGAGGRGGHEGGGGEEEPRLNLGTSSSLSKRVAFLNNLERDSRYQQFSSSLPDLLNTFPGRLRPLARNVFTAVVVAEPLCGASLELATTLERMWQNGYPIRFGVVFHLPAVVARVQQQRRFSSLQSGTPSWEEMDASERFGRAFATLHEAFGAPAAWRMWSMAAETVINGGTDDAIHVVEDAFGNAWTEAARNPPSGARAKAAARRNRKDAMKMLQEGSGYAAEVGMQLTDTASWLLAKGLVQAPPLAAAAVTPGGDLESCDKPPLVWLNGMTGRASGQPAEELMYKVMGEMQRLQEMIYFGRLHDGSGGGDVLSAIMELTGAVERVNPRIVGPAAKKMQVLPLAPLLRSPAHTTLVPLSLGEAPAPTSGSKPKTKSSGSSGSHVAPVTHYVVADLGSEEGRGLVAEAVRYLSGSSPGRAQSRVVLVVNPAAPQQPPSLLEAVVQGALRQAAGEEGAAGQRDKVVSFLSRLLSDGELVARLGEGLRAGSAEEAREAVGHAEKAGLDGSSLMSYLVRIVDEALLPEGDTRGGTSGLSYRAAQSDLCRAVFKLEPGAAAVVSNGRVTPVYRPGVEVHELLAEDLSLLQLTTSGGMAAAVARALQRAHVDKGPLQDVPPGLTSRTAVDTLSDMAAAVTAALGAAGQKAGEAADGGRQQMGPGLSHQLQSVISEMKELRVQDPGGPEPPFHLAALLNPLSRPAQRMAPLLLALRAALAPSMSLTINPQREVSEMPLKSYYRYALPQDVSPDGPPPGPPSALFARLPSRRVLTLNLEVPEAWLVEPAAADVDLDNLRLEDVPGQMAYADFELDALMLTGSCVDVTSSGRMTSPRGLQLHLGTPSQPHRVDTLVMANLAYFQLKASPGRWLLSLAPGRSRELYSLQSSTGTSPDSFPNPEEEGQGAGTQPGVDEDVSTQVLISSFQGKHMILRVRKRPGREDEDMLQNAGEGGHQMGTYDMGYGMEDDEYSDGDDDEEGSGGRRSSGGRKPLRGGDTINVFTVASGHMYERLQKIMILSVLKHTKSKVKFWIIKNYMSPQHRQVIPALAERFGFEYEFVTYKWPHWLHKQTDKQRLIWAYKILFLDVLFPLGVDRIIFVDSDQVVRTDLAELYHKDIKGAPYAYTPFCDNNKEMDEYRFWKGGFWKDHLQGKPYHISALYLVDLKRFRQMAAGDQLRVVYDQLSKDPNSLANLDQDLPNYAQHSIRIHSLPQEWLWCESWCGNATKAKAKTIDLCNNPKTKEPKLSAARRIIGGLWEELDAAQEEVTRAVVLQSRPLADEAVGSPAAAEGSVCGSEPGAETGTCQAGEGTEETSTPDWWATQDDAATTSAVSASGADHSEL